VKSNSPAKPAQSQTPGLFALVAEAGQDAVVYAKAEIELIKAQAAERASYAWPALALIFVAISLVAGALIAMLVGLIFILYARLGGWSVPVVVVGALLVAAGAGWWGVQRLRSAAKPPEAR